MTYQSITEADRKYHYWRGFRASLCLTIPLIVVLLVACNVAIDALIK